MDIFFGVFVFLFISAISAEALIPCLDEICDDTLSPKRETDIDTHNTLINPTEDEAWKNVITTLKPDKAGVHDGSGRYFNYEGNMPWETTHRTSNLEEITNNENDDFDDGRTKTESNIYPHKTLNHFEATGTPYSSFGGVYYTTRRPYVYNSRPYSYNNGPVSFTDRPYSYNKRQYSNTNRPYNSTVFYDPTIIPYSTTYSPYFYTKEFHSTTRRPYTATRSTYSTTRRPYSSTRSTHSTTRSPYTTTRSTYSTTRRPYTTTKSTYITTRRPYISTRNPYPTTRRPYTTTKRLYTPTRKHYSSSMQPHSTTRKPYSTTKGFHSTTGRSYSTSEGFYTTTVRPYISTRRPYYTTTTPYSSPIRPHDWYWYPYIAFFTTEKSLNSYSSHYKSHAASISDVRESGDLSALVRVLRGQLNISGFSLTGPEVMSILLGLTDSQPLRRLFLSQNSIRSLPRQMFPLQLEYHLQELWLDNNPLDFLGDTSCFELSRLKSLRMLSVSQSGLMHLGTLYLPVLEELDLSFNLLTLVPSSLVNLPNLLRLDLRGNQLTWLDSYPLTALTSLRVLALDDNGMSFIRDDPFGSLHNLQTLYLNNNSLSSVSFIETIPSGAAVTVGGNPWRCDSELLSFIRRAGPLILDKENITCISAHGGTPILLSSLSEYQAYLFNPDPLGWVKHRVLDAWSKINQEVASVIQWARRVRYLHIDNLYIVLEILFLLYAALQVYSLAVMIRLRRAEHATDDHPYTNLVEKEYI